MDKRRVLFLYSRLNGFVLSTLRALQASGRCERIDVVHWSNAGAIGNHYRPEGVDGVTFRRRDELDDEGLARLIEDVRPTTVYVSGWMDKGYLRAIRARRRAGQAFVTVAGLDDQWRGTWRQRVGTIWFRLAYRALIDVMWTAGPAQYHYARRFGYPHDRIVGNLLSADDARFRAGDASNRRFVYVGRFDPVKGLDALVEAHGRLPQETRAAWPLVLIGDGALRGSLEARATPEVRIVDYLQPDGVARELEAGGVGMLVSRWEQWGVSLHEMAVAGLPLIASVQAGATSTFLIDGHNGILVRGGDVADLTQALARMAATSDEERAAMGRASRELSKRITPQVAAASLLSAEGLARM
ncbi:MAG TPA: glycosyltransferase family 4 protein [Brevundimonas sp.]|jgi:glycosyltransferase involved in cell wall biosynthesis|uniref:glycosyltransferase family 4 protein n=1 Tax=Brevundimonas sp. TaxID=1871086 RepID=UPI002DE57DD0|nr:glycosyltransferase family 4 protein [Brevundimonas sp.]